MASEERTPGLGMLGVDDSYAKKWMGNNGGDGNEFLGGLLSFMGVGQEVQDQIKNFQKNPTGSIQNAIAPKVGPGYGPLANSGPMISNEGMEKGGGFSPSGIVPPTMQQPIANAVPVTVANPVAGAPAVVDPLELQRQETQRITNSLIPRNL